MVGVAALVLVASASTGGVSLFAVMVPLITTLAGLATIIGAVVMFRQGREERAKAAEKRHAEVVQLRTDFYGDQRPGVPARPGVLVLLDNLTAQVDRIHSEITPNHGGSMKDAISRIDTRLADVETDVKSLHDKTGA